ncbi:hypothetical protein GCM10019059_43850 [Camelimonas fluminis]|uniref:AAA family ATPase n=1 Tax=Camelimonas fluminis TaxID=1576911 RepID=A0ABV7UIB6_9HYPH|nr:AAA family ATPase [Camelimonas fluminis]GHE81020.1 hypothetical protein GCM10019059_43850 [Camelimonas fluminis]
MSRADPFPSIDMHFGAFEQAVLKTYFLNYLRASMTRGRGPLKQSVLQWYAQNKSSLELEIPSLSRSLSDASGYGDLVVALRSVELDMQFPRLHAPSALQTRIDWIAHALRLKEFEKKALGAVCRLTQLPPFMSFATALTEGYGDRDEVQATLVLMAIGQRKMAAHRLFSRNGRLSQLGLIDDRGGEDVAPSELVLSILRERTVNADRLMTRLLGEQRQPKLGVADFGHMASHVEDVTAILNGSLAQRATGVNILFYGAPGAGKTELAAMLGMACNARVVFVGEIARDKEEPGRSDRMAHLSLLSALGERIGRVIAVVDEAEDVLGGVGLLSDGRRGSSKVYLHRLIENCAIPTVWITNKAEEIDEAVIRRMIRVVEFRKPGAAITARIVRQQANDQGLQLDVDAVARLARSSVAPAIVSSSIRAASLGQGGAEMAISAARSFRKLIVGSEEASGASDIAFDLAWATANIDLTALADKVVRCRTTRLSFLFTGLPGTGKTAFAHYLAHLLRMDVLEKRTSDLVSKYVGETESRIAAAFAEARDGNYFLLFDEADSLLSDRAQASHSWEVSQVNEMLTWMERHPLPFAATSNMEARLDAAVNRRFLFKARFEALRRHQIDLVFRRQFGCETPIFLMENKQLTLGDFAVVKRQAEVMDINDANELACMLEQEAGLRPNAGRRIGFKIH